MTRSRFSQLRSARWLRRATCIAMACLSAGLGGCLLTPWNQTEDLSMTRADGLGDTVTVFPTLKIAFSVALEDSSVELVMEPPFACEYAQWLNATRDTLTISVGGMLEGGIRYTIRPAHTLTATNGTRLSPGNASMSFVTYPRESQQNGTLVTADTLRSRVCGMVEQPSDTDFYVVTDARGLRLVAYDVRCLFSIADSTGAVLARGASDGIDSVTVPDTVAPPWLVRVYAGTLESRQRYQAMTLP